LIPQTKSFTDFQEIKAFSFAFQKHSRRYSVGIPCLQPSVGDFYFSEAGGPTFVVELKRNCWQLSSSDVLQFGSFGGGGSSGPFKPTFLSPLAQWDLLFLLESNKQKSHCRLLIFFRDELPESWFQETQGGQSGKSWPLDKDLLRRRTIMWDGSAGAVSKLENILDELEVGWNSGRQQPRPMDSASLSSMTAALSLGASEEDVEEEAKGVNKEPKRKSGGGRKWSPGAWRARQMQWLDQQCDIQ
jgi:hypothetical protein